MIGEEVLRSPGPGSPASGSTGRLNNLLSLVSSRGNAACLASAVFHIGECSCYKRPCVCLTRLMSFTPLQTP